MVLERKPIVGGICINAGTIPSKTIREAVLYLSGYWQRGIYGQSYQLKERITLEDLRNRVQPVVRHEVDVSRHQLARNDVEITHAEASFTGPHTLRLARSGESTRRTVSARYIMIAVGTEATRIRRCRWMGRWSSRATT